jgi:nitrate reductase cytochrome c-type subunit
MKRKGKKEKGIRLPLNTCWLDWDINSAATQNSTSGNTGETQTTTQPQHKTQQATTQAKHKPQHPPHKPHSIEDVEGRKR